MYFKPLTGIKLANLKELSAYESNMIEEFAEMSYEVDCFEKSEKEINNHKFLFVHYYVYCVERHHRSMFVQLYVPYNKEHTVKLTYQVLGEPNSFRIKALDYIYSRFKDFVHVPSFIYTSSGETNAPVKIKFGDEVFLFESQSQARKQFPAQAVGYVNSTLPVVERKAILNNFLSKRMSFVNYVELARPNIREKIIDFLSGMKFDNIMTDHDIYEAFCKYYRPYDTYILYKFL